MTRPLLPDGLSMLWEPVDASEALQERFGFVDLAAAVAWVSAVLDEAWDITVRGCSRLVISGPNAIVWVRTADGGLVVKWSRDESRFPRLAASARLLGHLGRRGLPVAAPVLARDGRGRRVVEGPAGPLSVVVQPELVGRWLDVTDPAAVRASGACLARLHRELGGYTDERFATTSRIEVSREALQRWLAEGEGGRDSATSSHLVELLADLPDLDDEPQLVHDDFRAANILTRGSVVVGVLDFDEVSVGRRVGDLSYASTYLSTLFTGWGPTSDAVRQQLRAGYEAVRTLSPAESRWLDVLVLWSTTRAFPGQSHHRYQPRLPAIEVSASSDSAPCSTASGQ